jgi:hypothetical protein
MAMDDPDPLDGAVPACLPAIALHDPARPGRVRWIHGGPPAALVPTG